MKMYQTHPSRLVWKIIQIFCKNCCAIWISDVSTKCQPSWKKLFHHFVLMCANMCAKFHDHRIGSLETRPEIFPQFWVATRKCNRNRVMKNSNSTSRVTNKQHYKITLFWKFLSNQTDIFKELLPSTTNVF